MGGSLTHSGLVAGSFIVSSLSHVFHQRRFDALAPSAVPAGTARSSTACRAPASSSLSCSTATSASSSVRPRLARHARNRRLADALDQWAFCSLRQSPGACTYYDELRSRNKTHRQCIRQLANRWVGILHACLENRALYDEATAWKHRVDLAA